jgi:hypothetical protein
MDAPPPRLPKEKDRAYAARCDWLLNGGPYAQVGMRQGVSEAQVKRWASDHGWTSLKAQALLPPKPPVDADPARAALATVVQSLANVDPSTLSMMERQRLLDIAVRLMDMPVQEQARDWYPTMRTDMERALFADLEPLGTKGVDFRRLSFPQREALLFLIERATGSTAPWRQAGEQGPASPPVTDPDYETACGEENSKT